MHPPDETDLLHRCLAGDRRAWTTLVESLTRYVYYLIRLTARRHATEFTDEEMADLHNDLFLALFEDNCRRLRAWRGDNGCSLRSWIRVITIRRTIDALRRRRRHISLDAPPDDPLAAPALQHAALHDPAPDPLTALIDHQAPDPRAHLAQLTDDLNPTDRLLLEMIYLHHMSADAIAAALRINKGALYTRKTRLIKRLRALAEAPDTPPTQAPPTHEPR